MRLAATASATSLRVPVLGSPRAVTFTATISSGLIPSACQASEGVDFSVRVVRRAEMAVLMRSGLGSKFVRSEGSSIIATRDWVDGVWANRHGERMSTERSAERREG